MATRKHKAHKIVAVVSGGGHTTTIYDKRPHIAHAAGDSLKGIIVNDPWKHKGSAPGQGGSRRPSTKI